MANPADKREGAPLHGAWYVAGVLGVTNFFSSIDRYVTGVLMVPIKTSLGLNDTQVGLIQGLGFALLYAVFTLPMGWLSDRASRRNIILVGTFVWTIATGMCSMANSFLSLFLARLATGFGEATLLPSAMSLLSSYFGRERLGRAISLFNMMSGFGKATSFMLFGWLLTRLEKSGGLFVAGAHFEPWQAAFLVAGCAGLPLIALQLTVREPPKPVQQSRPDTAHLRAYVSRHRLAYLLHLGCGGSVLILGQVLAAWGPSLFVRSFNMSLAQAGLTVGLASLILSPVMILGGLLIDRLNRRGIAGAPGLVMGASAAAFVPCIAVFALTTNPIIAIAAFALAEVCVYIASQPAFVGIQLMSPPQDRGLATAVFFGISSIIAMGFGPPIIGILSDQVFADAGQRSLALAMLTAGAIFGVAALIFGTIRRPYSRAFSEQQAKLSEAGAAE